MGKVAFLFAGQGSQRPGMGAGIASVSPAARAVFEAADAVRPGTSGQCFEGTAEELSQTANTQPCVFSVDLACARALLERGIRPDVVAGFSLGEVAALTFAGAFDDEEGFALVCRRAELMAEAAAAHPGAMRAVLKLDAVTVEELASRAGADTDGACWPVNYNSPLQTAVAGSPAACERLDELVREAGGRAVRVSVSGAFHSPYMAEAAEGLAAYLETHEPAGTQVPVVANRSARPYPFGASEAAALLSEQVKNPVRWVETLHWMAGAGVDTFVEVGPGKTLQGLVKRTLEGVSVFGVETPEQLEAVAATLCGGKDSSDGQR